MTITFETDLYRVKVNHNAKCLSQRSFSSKIIVWTDTETEPIVLPVPLKLSAINPFSLDSDQPEFLIFSLTNYS